MKKALIYSSVASMIDQFNRDNIQILKKLGYEVEVACNFEKGNTINREQINKLKRDLEESGVKWHHIAIPRNLNSLKEIWASYSLSKQIIDNGDFNLIHFHSPIGAAIGRMAARKSRKKGTKIIYTAHGFHFFKGSPLLNWLMYYPLEFSLSRYTDALITINHEDYQRAKSFKAKKVEYVPGIGIDTKEIKQLKVCPDKKRTELGIQNELLLLSIGELNKNKNHKMILSALSSINKPFKYVICGQGDELSDLTALAQKLNLKDKVLFLGYRNDVKEILKIADIYCFPSKREGLSVALMEAMAAGLPCLVSNIRGNNDLIDTKGGLLFDLDSPIEVKQGLEYLIESKSERKKMGEYNLKKIEKFDKEIVNIEMKRIYSLT